MFCTHSVFMCFVWISEQTAIISLYNMYRLVFITETECVYCAVWSESLSSVFSLALAFKGLSKTRLKPTQNDTILALPRKSSRQKKRASKINVLFEKLFNPHYYGFFRVISASATSAAYKVPGLFLLCSSNNNKFNLIFNISVGVRFNLTK
jgi:hypothetical protein